jgi:hypothetical protein
MKKTDEGKRNIAFQSFFMTTIEISPNLNRVLGELPGGPYPSVSEDEIDMFHGFITLHSEPLMFSQDFLTRLHVHIGVPLIYFSCTQDTLIVTKLDLPHLNEQMSRVLGLIWSQGNHLYSRRAYLG